MVITARGRVRNGKIDLAEPLELPDGTEIEISVSPVEPAEATGTTGQEIDLRNEPLFGMWADREDMADSVEWVRRQREQWHKRFEPRD